MVRANSVLLLVAMIGLLSASATRAGESPTTEQAKRAAEARKKLAAPIAFNGFDDPDIKLDDVLVFLTRTSGIAFEVNEQAFKDEALDNVLDKSLGKEIPKMANVSAESVLRRVLARIPTPSGTTFVVRGGVVEITTRRYTSPGNWGTQGGADEPTVVPPEVSLEFEKRALQEALQEIADATGVNIVLDARVGDKGKTPVTATMRAVGVDTAVQLLANMADLTTMPVENVLYVTTKEKARALRAEVLKLESDSGQGPPAEKTEPAPAPADSERVLKDRDEKLRRLKAKLKRKQPTEPAPKKDQ
jgi:hypothetical protein